MKLEIDRKYGLDFVLFVIKQLQKYIIGNVNPDKLVFAETYINDKSKSMFRKYLSAYDIVVSGAMSITYNIYEHKFIVELNSNEILYGTNAKIIDLCKLINYGVIGVLPYPIFTDSFEHFEKNLIYYYEYYLRNKSRW